MLRLQPFVKHPTQTLPAVGLEASSKTAVRVACTQQQGVSRGTPPHSSRRAVLQSGAGALSLLLTQRCPAEAAEPVDIPLKNHISKTLRAPAEFLRSRLRADGGAKILAPIRASRIKLQAAEKALATINIYDPSPDTYKNILQQIRSASMNCYAFEPLDDDTLEARASAFQRSIGVADACTYRLIAKNVTLLLVPSQQQLKEETLKQLEELINSYQLLDDMVDRARDGELSAVERIPDVLQFTLAHVSAFETLIERCLGLPVSNRAPTIA